MTVRQRLDCRIGLDNVRMDNVKDEQRLGSLSILIFVLVPNYSGLSYFLFNVYNVNYLLLQSLDIGVLLVGKGDNFISLGIYKLILR